MLEWVIGFSLLFLLIVVPQGLGLVMRRFDFSILTGESPWEGGGCLMLIGLFVLGIPYLIGAIVLLFLSVGG